nr:MAG TPA: hypothetical protein [Bacteriophage sp.]
MAFNIFYLPLQHKLTLMLCQQSGKTNIGKYTL